MSFPCLGQTKMAVEAVLACLLVTMSCIIIRQVSLLTVTCGDNLCLCNDATRAATCKPAKGRTNLSFFPKLPSHITNVTFKDYIRPRIFREDLTNLTYLPLIFLQLENTDTTYMEEGLFQSFSGLKTLNISNNQKLSPLTLREVFRNTSSSLEGISLASNNLKNVSDLFHHLYHTNLKMLDLARNPSLHLQVEVLKKFRLETLNMSFSGINNLTTLCPKQPYSFLPTLQTLLLQSTNITKIPPHFFFCFPSLKTLNLEDNNLNSFLSFCDTFQNFTNATIDLEELYLGNTGLRGHISSSSFHCFSKLIRLELDRNMITNIPDFCNSDGNNSKIEQLNLQYTSISGLREDNFKCLYSLQFLDLKHNILKDVPNFCSRSNSSYTPHLKHLYLRNTSIVLLSGYKFLCLPKLQELDLCSNCLKVIPSFCNENNSSVNPSLTALDLSWNEIHNIFANSFRCLSSLKTLRLRYITISKLENNVFRPLTSLRTLEISNCKNLKHIRKDAFNISSVVTLTFSYNDFKFKDISRYFPDYLFRFCKNVTKLVLSGNHFPTNPVAQTILRPLEKLKYLYLTNSRLDTIHEHTFNSSRRLRTIFLDNNRLTGWDKNVFNNLSQLSYLNLAFNKIAVFDKNSIPMKILNNLKVFNLAYNPFDCGCDMIWFKRWSLTTNVTLLSFPRMYSCQTPVSMFHKPLVSLTLTEEDCKEKNPWLVVITSVSAGALLLLFVSITISIQMPTIKNYMYYLRLKKMGYVKLINEQEFTYDAYVVYCEEDENWVIHTLVSVIESKGFRLCIPDREFEVGADRCDQIISAFNESKKILVVFSNNFAKNEWCLWQLNLVEERLRRSGNSAVIFVLYKNISSKNMISSLHRTLKQKAILTWYEGGRRENMFWKVVVLALGSPLGEPPISVIQ